MTDPADTLADLRRHLQILLSQPVPGPRGDDSEDVHASRAEESGEGGAAKIGPELYAGLQFLQERDAQIQNELLRLQRTLWRQSFRGAESSRRLVRRLARRAQENITDAEAMKTRLADGIAPTQEDLLQLCTVIEALRAEGVGRAGSNPSHPGDPSARDGRPRE
jgi:hypothetical protein